LIEGCYFGNEDWESGYSRDKDGYNDYGCGIKIEIRHHNHFSEDIILSVQKVLSGSRRAGSLRLMGKYVGLRLVARPEPVNTFWTDSTRN